MGLFKYFKWEFVLTGYVLNFITYQLTAATKENRWEYNSRCTSQQHRCAQDSLGYAEIEDKFQKEVLDEVKEVVKMDESA